MAIVDLEVAVCFMCPRIKSWKHKTKNCSWKSQIEVEITDTAVTGSGPPSTTAVHEMLCMCEGNVAEKEDGNEM